MENKAFKQKILYKVKITFKEEEAGVIHLSVLIEAYLMQNTFIEAEKDALEAT